MNLTNDVYTSQEVSLYVKWIMDRICVTDVNNQKPDLGSYLQKLKTAAIEAHEKKEYKGVLTAAKIILILYGGPTDEFVNLENLLKKIHEEKKEIDDISRLHLLIIFNCVAFNVMSKFFKKSILFEEQKRNMLL